MARDQREAMREKKIQKMEDSSSTGDASETEVVREEKMNESSTFSSYSS